MMNRHQGYRSEGQEPARKKAKVVDMFAKDEIDDDFAKFQAEMAALEEPQEEEVVKPEIVQVVTAKPQKARDPAEQAETAVPWADSQMMPIVPTEEEKQNDMMKFKRVNPNATPEEQWASFYRYEKNNESQKRRDKKHIRHAAGELWEDKTLSDFPDNDFRIFVGDLGNDVNDEHLASCFKEYSSFTMAKVIRDKKTTKSKGYGFVSLMDPQDFIKALREKNGKYCGNRPMKLRKSTWKDRTADKPTIQALKGTLKKK